MNHSINLISTILFSNLIIFLAITFSPYLSPRGVFFGVRLEEKYKKAPEIRKITRTYLYECTVSFIVITLLTMGLIYSCTSEKSLTFIVIASMILLVAICFACFVKAYNHIKSFAQHLNASSDEVAKTVVDTDLMKAKNKLRRHFRYLYILPIILALATTLYMLLSYNSLPSRIPTHWNFLGQADGWQLKTPVTVSIYGLLQVALVSMLCYISDQIFTTRGRLDQANYELSKKIFLSYLKKIGYSFYVMLFSIEALFIFTTFSMVHATPMQPAALICSLLLPLGATIYMCIAWFRYRKDTPSYASYSPENADNHWIWGSFYYNPDDPSTFVEKRYGIGWTINMATPLGKGLMIGLLLIIIINILLPLFRS